MESRPRILWKDGIDEKVVPTTQFYYLLSLDSQKIFLGEWVFADGKEDLKNKLLRNNKRNNFR